MVIVLVPIAVILTAYVAYAASRQSHAWADALVHWIANFPVVGAALAKVLGSMLVNGADWISNRLGSVYLGLQSRAVNWLGGLAHYARMAADATIDWPIDLITWARWLVGTEIPKMVHGLPNSATKLVHAARVAIAGVEADLADLTAHIPGRVRKMIAAALTATLGPFLLPLHWLHAVWRKIEHAAAAAGGIAVPWIEVPRLRRAERSLERRFGKVWALLGVAGAVALLARALKISTRCVRDGNIGKAARRWCGLDSSWVDSLLADLLTIASVLSVVEFAKDLRAIEDEALKILAAGIREFPS